MPISVVPFQDLAAADLRIDAIYEGGTAGTAADDPLARLLPGGNQGGFRYKKHPSGKAYLFLILYTDLGDPDWPDHLDVDLGRFTYYGDNKRPGHALHETPRGGNQALRDLFEAVHASPPQRETVPPIFVFSKTRPGRRVVFRGLAVPGAREVSAADDLVAIWRTAEGQRFQNYRAIFTILDAAVSTRAWLNEILAGSPETAAPGAWLRWRRTGLYTPLVAKQRKIRSREEQLPATLGDQAMVQAIYEYFDDPHEFEKCAASLWALEAAAVDYEVTRASVDGGRDAIGEYRLGLPSDPIRLTFALEAKRYETGGVGVRDLARLISRLRHREFGVLVTTSYVSRQAYTEIRDDQHPIIVISAADIVAILKKHGFPDTAAVRAWLEREFPKGPSRPPAGEP
jgi:Restriction endonuclease AspBHI N-terminal/Restriction endonuclease